MGTHATRAMCLVCLLAAAGGCNISPLRLPDTGTTYESNGGYRCWIHDRPLRTGIVPIWYGLPPAPGVGDYDYSMLHFPNALSFAEGGCSMEPDSPTRTWVWYCPDCREAEKQWLASTKERKVLTSLDFYADELSTSPLDPATLAARAMQQSKSEIIWAGLGTLRDRFLMAKTAEKRPVVADAYVSVLRKLESGWPGYEGHIYSVEHKVPQRTSPADMLTHEYGTLAFFAATLYRRDPAVQELYERIRPDSGRAELLKAWTDAKTALAQERALYDAVPPTTRPSDSAGR